MKVHLLGLPQFPVSRDASWCAYTQKIRKLANMLVSVGIDVTLYASEGSDTTAELIEVVTAEQQRGWLGHRDWTTDVFNEFDPSSEHWSAFNDSAIEAMRDNIAPGDILGVTMGLSQKPIADFVASRGALPVEVGIGYSGVFSQYRVFESWAWRNYITGRYGPTDDVHFYDTVIPNFFEPSDFPLGTGSGDYFLFMGRLTERKGPHIAAAACERLGAKLLVAGQGEYPLPGDVEYLGVVGPEQRAELMGDAIATFCPSIYLEPFCGVSVESQLCGTPVIGTNWGALVENISEGSGFLCDTLAEFVAAAELAPTLDRISIQKKAVDRWSVDVLAWDYVRYFTRLQTLFGEGWYA